VTDQPAVWSKAVGSDLPAASGVAIHGDVDVAAVPALERALKAAIETSAGGRPLRRGVHGQQWPSRNAERARAPRPRGSRADRGLPRESCSAAPAGGGRVAVAGGLRLPRGRGGRALLTASRAKYWRFTSSGSHRPPPTHRLALPLLAQWSTGEGGRLGVAADACGSEASVQICCRDACSAPLLSHVLERTAMTSAMRCSSTLRARDAIRGPKSGITSASVMPSTPVVMPGPPEAAVAPMRATSS